MFLFSVVGVPETPFERRPNRSDSRRHRRPRVLRSRLVYPRSRLGWGFRKTMPSRTSCHLARSPGPRQPLASSSFCSHPRTGRHDDDALTNKRGRNTELADEYVTATYKETYESVVLNMFLHLLAFIWINWIVQVK